MRPTLRTMSMLTRLASRRALAAPLLSARHLATRRVLPAGTRIPTAEDAASLPRHVRELSGEALLILVKSGPEDSSAARERLLRDVMHIDGVKYEDAADKVEEMARYNYGRMGMLPYEVGIQTAITAGWLSIPLVFSYTVAKKFNDVFVTAEPPDVGEMDTILEIGSWTWGWMEPPLGTISFFLLCMQYSRDQRLNMGQKPYTEWYKSQRADRLAAAFPAYTTEIVRDYAKATAFDHSDCDGIDDMPNDPNATDADIADTGKARSDVGRQRAAR